VSFSQTLIENRPLRATWAVWSPKLISCLSGTFYLHPVLNPVSVSAHHLEEKGWFFLPCSCLCTFALLGWVRSREAPKNMLFPRKTYSKSKLPIMKRKKLGMERQRGGRSYIQLAAIMI
jgi:hypothetical protein